MLLNVLYMHILYGDLFNETKRLNISFNAQQVQLKIIQFRYAFLYKDVSFF